MLVSCLIHWQTYMCSLLRKLLKIPDMYENEELREMEKELCPKNSLLWWNLWWNLGETYEYFCSLFLFNFILLILKLNSWHPLTTSPSGKCTIMLSSSIHHLKCAAHFFPFESFFGSMFNMSLEWCQLIRSGNHSQFSTKIT